MLRAAILTISDKGHRGERADRSSQVIRETLAPLKCDVVKYEIVPDEADQIAAKLRRWADSGDVDVILTTGGTGLGPRDVTPEATLSAIEKLTPGIPELIRVKTFDKAPNAILSRAVAGSRGKCLIINLPGSPRAVKECLEIVLGVIPHAVEILTGVVTEHNIPPEK